MSGLGVAMGAQALLGLAQGVGNVLANRKYQKFNTAQIERLQKRRAKVGFGLTPKQEDLLATRLNAPVQAATQQMRSRAEQIQASTGMGSGADASRLRTEQARTVADAAQKAALQVSQADQQKRQAQRQELEQRMATQSAMRADNVNSFFGAASQGAAAAGALAAQPKLSNLFAGTYTPEEMNELSTFATQNPEQFSSIMSAILAKMGTATAGATAGAGMTGTGG